MGELDTVPPVSQTDLDEICDQTAELWKDFRGQRIFVTGGTGFFGCWLLESFAAANERFKLQAQMTVLTRSPENFERRCPHLAERDSISLLAGDVRNFEFPDGEFRFVIHAATDARPKQAGALATISTIVDGTRRTLEFAARHETRRLLLVSSGAVYGAQPAEITHVPENYRGGPDPCAASSAYGEGKRVAETLCAGFAENAVLECAIARCFAFVGPHLPLDQSYAIGNFLGSALAGQSVRIGGDGTALRSYLYASDLMVWLWTLLAKGPSMRPVNVGSEDEISIHALAEEVLAALGVELPIEIAGTRQPGAAPSRYVPSVASAKELGLRQTVSLGDAIQRTARWHAWTAKSSR